MKQEYVYINGIKVLCNVPDSWYEEALKMNIDEHLELCKKHFKSARKGLWDWVLPSYLLDVDNPRIDCYQNTKENRVIMMALMDIQLRLKEIEEKIK